MAKETLFKSFGDSRLDGNFSKLESLLNNNYLFRLNIEGEPNQMEQELDMNSNDINNAGTIRTADLFVGGADIQSILTAAAMGNAYSDEFTDGVDFTTGVTTTLTLSAGPGVKDNTHVYFDGIKVKHSDYALTAYNEITFTSPIVATDVSVDFYTAAPVQGTAGDYNVGTDPDEIPLNSYLSSTYLTIANNLSDVANAAAARSNLGISADNTPYDNSISGLTATDVNAAIDEVVADLPGKVIATGTAVFTNATNNIFLPNIGVGNEVGDVIQIAGSTNNDTEFTIDSITDNDNVIVNAAHAGGITSKSLVDETASVTVTLLCKWYLAGSGLGRDYADVTASRMAGSDYTENPNRDTEVLIVCTVSVATDLIINVDGVNRFIENTSAGVNQTLGAKIPKGAAYRVVSSAGTVTLVRWSILA